MCAAVAQDSHFGKWQILSVINSGSFGVVFRVAHEDTKSVAAAKRVLSTTKSISATPAFHFKQFKGEARNLARVKELEIPNAVSLIEYIEEFTSTEDWKIVLVMDYFAGKCLDELFIETKNRIRLHQIGTILSKGLETLSFLDQKQLIHGDITPNNVLLFGKKMRFIDWTTLHSSHADLEIIPTSRFVASPEMLLLQTWDRTTDVFSFAATIASVFIAEWWAGGKDPSIRSILTNYELAFEDRIPESLVDRCTPNIQGVYFNQSRDQVTGERQFTLRKKEGINQTITHHVSDLSLQNADLMAKVVTLLKKMGQFDPARRIKAKDAYDETCKIFGEAAL